MKKLAWLLLLAVGIALLVFGVRASDTFGAGMAQTFAGSPTPKAVLLLIAGLIVSLVGLGGLLRNSDS